MMYFDAALVEDMLLLFLCGVALVVAACGLMYFLCALLERTRVDFREEYRERKDR